MSRDTVGIAPFLTSTWSVLKNEGYRRHPARGSQRLPHTGRRLASCRLTKQRLINALAAEIDERAALSEGTELLYRTKFRRCYRKALHNSPTTHMWECLTQQRCCAAREERYNLRKINL